MQTHKLMRLSIFALLAFNLLAIGLSPAQATAGTAGSVECSSNTYLEDSLVSIHCYGLTKSADFTLTFTAGGPSNITFTTSASQNTFDITLTMSAPTSGSTMTVTLTGGTDTGEALGSATMVKQAVSDLLPQDLLIDVGIAVMVILIIVGIVAGLAIVGKRRLAG